MEMATMSTLDFADTKRRSSGARSYSVKIAPSNGATFNCGGQIQLNLPNSVANTYCDMDSVFIKFKVTNNDGNAVFFDGINAASLFNSVAVLQAGQTLSQLNFYNVLYNALSDLNTSANYANINHYLSGADNMGKRYKGAEIGAGGSREVCLPLSLIGIAESSPRKFYPLFSSSNTQIRIDLEEAVNAFFSTAAGLTNADIVISDCELIANFIELAPQVQAQVNANCGGVYQMSVVDYTHAGATLANGVSSLTSTLGIARSSLERLIITHRVSANIGNVQQFTLNNRSKADLTQFQASNSGQMLPARPVKVSASGAEVFAQMLVGDHALVDKSKQTNFMNFRMGEAVPTAGTYNIDAGTLAVAGTDPAAMDTIGSFLAILELEQQGSGGSDRIFSGIDTLSGATFQYQALYDTAPAAMNVDFWGMSTIMLTLDTNVGGGNVWIASV